MTGPIGLLVGLLTPSPLGPILSRVRPNGLAPGTALGMQRAVAADVATAGALRGGLSGRSGSEADYPEEQASGDAALGAPLLHVTDGLASRVPRPTSWYTPNLPAGLIEGRGTGYVTDAYNKGWVILRRLPWGGSTRDHAPIVVDSTLLSPRDRAPLPADMATTYAATHKGATRLEDMFGD